MFQPKINLERDLYQRLKKTAASAGYSSVDEFVTHLLDKAAADAERRKARKKSVDGCRGWDTSTARNAECGKLNRADRLL